MLVVSLHILAGAMIFQVHPAYWLARRDCLVSTPLPARGGEKLDSALAL